MATTYAVVTSGLVQSPKSANTLVFSTNLGNVGVSKGMSSIINKINELRSSGKVAVVALEDHKKGDFIYKGGIATRDSATLWAEGMPNFKPELAGAPIYKKGDISPKWSEDGRGVSSVMTIEEAQGAVALQALNS